MNLLSVFSFIPTLLTIVGDLPKALQAFEFLLKAITDAESTTLSGPDKLTAVLNDFEAGLNAINPAWGGEFDPIAKDVEAVVNSIVAVYNQFAHAKPAAAPAA